jgi:hypothetical protein
MWKKVCMMDFKLEKTFCSVSDNGHIQLGKNFRALKWFLGCFVGLLATFFFQFYQVSCFYGGDKHFVSFKDKKN